MKAQTVFMPPITVSPHAVPAPTVVTMAVCWYTRDHEPAHTVRAREDGRPVYARCCHCHRDIASIDGRHWAIAGTFDAEAAGRRRTHAFISVVDVLDEIVLARFPIGTVPDERGVAALRAHLTRRYRLDDADCTLELRDSRDH